MLVLTNSEFELAQNEINGKYVFLQPILVDANKHAACNNLCALYVYVLHTKSEYLIIYNHPAKIIEPKELNFQGAFIYNKKQLLHMMPVDADKIIDINLYLHMTNQNIIDVNKFKTITQIQLEEKFHNISNIRKSVALNNLLVWCRNCKDEFLQIDITDTNGFKFYNNIALKSLYSIEKTGIQYNNLDKFFKYKQKYFSKNLLFSEYNPYTSTGRPSNCYGGINFAALNKDNGERSIINSRFNENGLLIELDFESYHIRLIADLIGYELPNENAHIYLAKQYFQKEDVTIEEIKQAKGITWQLLYGGIQEEFKVIPFFKQTDEYIRKLWNENYVNKEVYTKIANKKIIGKFENKYKLFNYLLQAHETERNMQLILKISEFLDNYNSKMILYVYDSFLFDINTTELKNVLPQLVDILNEGKYPVSIKYGVDYHTMQKYKQK